MGGKIGVVRKWTFYTASFSKEKNLFTPGSTMIRKNTLCIHNTLAICPKEFANELLIKLYFLYFAKNDSLHVFLVHHLYNNCAADEFGCTTSIIGLYRLRFANDSLHNPKPFSSSSIELILVSAH